jgi:hypothetical protein
LLRPLRRRQLKRLISTQPDEFAAIDPVLLDPVLDRRFADADTSTSAATFVPDRASSTI